MRLCHHGKQPQNSIHLSQRLKTFKIFFRTNVLVKHMIVVVLLQCYALTAPIFAVRAIPVTITSHVMIYGLKCNPRTHSCIMGQKKHTKQNKHFLRNIFSSSFNILYFFQSAFLSRPGAFLFFSMRTCFCCFVFIRITANLVTQFVRREIC